MNTKPALRSTDGRTLRVEMAPYSWSIEEAHAIANQISHVAATGENLPDRHERHVNLMASCPLCVGEAGGQLDRLIWTCECGHLFSDHQTGNGPWTGFCGDADCECEAPTAGEEV